MSSNTPHFRKIHSNCQLLLHSTLSKPQPNTSQHSLAKHVSGEQRLPHRGPNQVVNLIAIGVFGRNGTLDYMTQASQHVYTATLVEIQEIGQRGDVV